MAKTFFGYWEVAQAIQSILQGISWRDGDPLVLLDDRELASERRVVISLIDRDDQLVDRADIAANQQAPVRAAYGIDIYQGHVEGTEAARLRNRMLEEIEVELLANPKLNGTVRQSFVGPVTLLERQDGDNYWSMCALRLDCLKTITTQ